jgi:flagellar assembly protein FliH
MSEMSTIFTRDFDAEIEEEILVSPEEPEPLTEADLEVARAEGFAAGREVGRGEGFQEALETIDGRRMELASRMEQQIRLFFTEREAHDQALEAQFVDFAISVGEKVFPELIETQSHQRSLAQIRRGLRMAMASRRLLVHLSEDAVEMLESDIRRMAESAGYDGRLDVFPDHDLEAGDVRISWDMGGLDYSFCALSNEIMEALRHARPVRR